MELESIKKRKVISSNSLFELIVQTFANWLQ